MASDASMTANMHQFGTHFVQPTSSLLVYKTLNWLSDCLLTVCIEVTTIYANNVGENL